MSKTGYFISIEGVEGVGKSTALLYIQTMLDDAGIEYVMTREPGGTELAEKIREVLLNQHTEKLTDITELLLMFASRAQNVAQLVRPTLAGGKWVIADRFTDASFAYQGGGRGISMDVIKQLAQLVQGDLTPNLTLLLDAPVAVGFARIAERGAKDRIEVEKQAFFERVRQQYLALAENEPERFRVISADKSIADVRDQLSCVLEPIIKAHCV